ncbi:hypothetical protein [Nocardia sp. NBC_01009]|uniref:hypothetical protein n=1 Tax=Nocardia sp. NBC_01009 TaxID=2975996 RepID=UPI00386A8F10|nr:hypothetical protein OHA42_17770 [Nocardia sp. NBC_01009]
MTELLGGADASALARVQPLIAALATAHPDSVGHWVADRTSAGILADLATSGAELTHEELDKLPQNGRTHYLRELLVAVGLLPRRNESLAQLQLWVDRTVATLPAPHQTLIRAYAEWYIVRRARQRAARGPFRPTADRSNRSRIQAAINFLAWLDSAGTSAAELTQHHIDTYLDTRPSNIAALLTFVSWMLDRRIITDIEITRPKDGLPQRFQDHDEHTAQLRRCLIDDSLPLEIRIIGALIRLYAIPAVRIVELTADRFCRDETYAYLVGDQNPVVLPPSLAQLIEAQIDKGGPSSMLRNQNLDGPRYLFPGRPASRHRNVHSVLRGLSQHGLATLTARNTAMITNVLELDAVVVSDLYGVAPQTAHKWAQYVQASWAAYLSAGR